MCFFVDNFESLATFGGSLDNLPIAMIQNDSNKVEKILNIIRSTLELLCKSFEKLPLGGRDDPVCNFLDALIKLFPLLKSL